MYRLLIVAAGLALAALTVHAADDAVELKHYPPTVGGRVRVTDEERTTTRTVVKVGDQTENKLEKRVKVIIYTSETLAVKKGEKKATKIRAHSREGGREQGR